MERQLRIKALKEIQQGEAYTSGIRIPYRSETLNLDSRPEDPAPSFPSRARPETA